MKSVFNFCVFIFIFFFQLSAWTKTKSADWNVEIFPFGWQYRYEDMADQTRAQRSYQHYFFSIQRNNVRFGLEFNDAQSETGNNSARIKEKINDNLASIGYQFFYNSWDDQTNSTVSVLATGFIGMTRSEVETILLGVSQTNTGDNEMVWGFGFNSRLTHKFFVGEAFGQVFNSPNFSPQEVVAWGFRLGLHFKF